jgi:hypothetical protein
MPDKITVFLEDIAEEMEMANNESHTFYNRHLAKLEREWINEDFFRISEAKDCVHNWFMGVIFRFG